MTELDRTWAETQIEGLADGSLSAEAEARMRRTISRDPELARRVEHARALKNQLRGLSSGAVPSGLWWRLWKIPAREPRTAGMSWLPAGALVAAGVVAMIGASYMFYAPEPVIEDERAAAVQDFAVAVAYLQKSALVARNEVNEAVGSSVLTALAASRGTIERTERGFSEGDREDDD